MAAKLSAVIDLHHHHHHHHHHHRHQPAYFTTPTRLSPNKKLTILCTSSKANPSLSDQLKPLSTTILSDPTRQTLARPKSVWVNPAKPKPTVLSPSRQKRSSYTYNPQFRDLKDFAGKLNDCDPLNDAAFEAILEEIPHPPSRENALLVLNSLKPWHKSLAFFNWIKTKNLFPMETIFYNVTMKSLRFGRQFQHIENLANEMIENGVQLDNITYSTIISCAKRCNLFDKALEWFESMYKTGVMPDEVTYSAVLDVYAKLGKVEEVISLYERGRASGWMPDHVAFSVLCKMFGEAGDYDGIKYTLQEMKALGVEPNLVVYNTLLEAMGKTGKPGLARSLFEEMVDSGITPDEKTLTSLIKVYGKARWAKDALELWERMKVNGWPMDFILYNSLLSMCADLGLEEEADKLFEDMKRLDDKCRPDSWSYTAMLNIYGSGAKVEKAMKLFDEMREEGIELNVMGCTCLLQCLGKGGRIDDFVCVFEASVVDGEIRPDDRLCGCLLAVLANCDGEDRIKVLGCLKKANPSLVELIKMLEDEKAEFEDVKMEFRGVLNKTSVDTRRPFCNCLIDICRNRGLVERAHELLYMGTLYGLYPGLHTKTAEEWRLNVRSLSVGATHTALEEWMQTLTKIVQRREVLPELLSANTGAGTHKFSQGLANAFAAHMEKLGAPFQMSEEKAGVFLASRDDVVSWVQSNAQKV